MREQEDQFNSDNIRIAVVTFENDFFARQYVEETGLTWPLLIDASREVYRGYGMLAASFWDVWGPKRSMRERAASFNGLFLLESRPGKGTEIIVEIPQMAPVTNG